jgi:hypothetical protein
MAKKTTPQTSPIACEGARCSQHLGALLTGMLLVVAFSAPANAQIRNPGAHPRYAAELDLHLVWQWADEPWWNDEGIGLGMRASIPLLDNGPIETINNNLAITFGLDWAHFDGNCERAGFECDANDFWIPVAVQWNFFLSRVVSLYPEIGLALQHSTYSTDVDVPGCRNVRGFPVCGDDDDTDIEFVIWLGSRFNVSEDLAITLRLGLPSLLLGVSFLL